MKCPVCRNELKSEGFMIYVDRVDNPISTYHCEHCECHYELGPDGDKQVWWKVTKLPIIVDDSDAKYKLYEIECVCTGEVVSEYPLGEFERQRERFSYMSSSYSQGEGYQLVIAREDEFDEVGCPTFDTDERVLCHQGDCGPRFHLEAAKRVKLWRDVLGI